MGFPNLVAGSMVSTPISTLGQTHPITPAANVSNGNRVYCAVGVSNLETLSWPAGWNAIANGVQTLNASHYEIRYKDATGAESSFNITSSGDAQIRAVCWANEDHHADPPILDALFNNTSSADYNSPALTPSYGQQEYQFFMINMFQTGGRAVDAYPLANNNFTNEGNNAAPAIAIASTQADADNIAAGAWSLTFGSPYVAFTMAVKPATAASPVQDGTVQLFHQFLRDLLRPKHDFDNHTFNLVLLKKDASPANDPSLSDVSPVYADYSANEVVDDGSSYTAGGVVLDNITVTLTNGVVSVTADDESILQAATGFDDAEYGVIINDSLAAKDCVGLVNLGAITSIQVEGKVFDWADSGIFRYGSGTVT